EGDRDDEDEVVEGAAHLADRDQAAEQDDAVNGGRAGHQRRVQRVRDLRDHREAHKRRQHQDGDLGYEAHDAPCWVSVAAPAAFFAPSCTISPSRVTQAPATTSSSKFRLSSPSSPVISSRRDITLREYSCDACSGIVLGRFSGEVITTSSSTIVSPGWVSSPLPP